MEDTQDCKLSLVDVSWWWVVALWPQTERPGVNPIKPQTSRAMAASNFIQNPIRNLFKGIIRGRWFPLDQLSTITVVPTVAALKNCLAFQYGIRIHP